MRQVYPFGMIKPLANGRNKSAGYRFGFNGMESDDEMHDQSGSSYDFGARMYNPRIGRWLADDPLTKLYPKISPFTAFGNSPVVFYDVAGEYIKPGSKKSMEDLQHSWEGTFKLADETSPMADIFKASMSVLRVYGPQTSGQGGPEENKTIVGNAINVKSREYKKAYKKLSSDQQRLADDYVAVINSDVETFFLSANDETKMPHFDDKDVQHKYGGQDLKTVLKDHGGGFTFKDVSGDAFAGGSGESAIMKIIVVVNLDLLTNIKVTIGEEATRGDATGTVSVDEVIVHEVLGHGLGHIQGTAGAANDDKAIEVGNVQRSQEGKAARNGNDHKKKKK